MSLVCSVMLALLAGLAPFWLGSNRPLPWAAHGVMFGFVLTLAAMAVAAEGRRYPALQLGRLAAPLALIGFGLLWAIVQVLPLDGVLPVHPAWSVSAQALNEFLSGRISINPTETQWALLRWGTAGTVLLAAYCLGREVTNASVILRTLLVMASLAGLYGLMRLSLSLDKILWFDEVDAGYLTSGFINRNSAATFFGMMSLAAFGVVISRVRRIQEQTNGLSARQKTEAWTGGLAGGLGVDLVIFALLFVSLLATGSRGGILFSISALLVLLLLYSVRRSGRRERSMPGAGWVLVTIASCLLIVGLFELAGVRVMSRLAGQGLESEARLDTYQQVLVSIRDYLWYGSGLGTFQDVFPAYRLEIAPGRQVWDKAHNDYIELVLGLGLPAALLVLAGLLVLAWTCLKGFFNRRREQHYAAIAFSVFVLVGLHSLVDFSLQIQANTIAFVLLIGLGLAQSQSSRTPR